MRFNNNQILKFYWVEKDWEAVRLMILWKVLLERGTERLSLLQSKKD